MAPCSARVLLLFCAIVVRYAVGFFFHLFLSRLVGVTAVFVTREVFIACCLSCLRRSRPWH